MSRITSLSEWVLKLPLVWGGLACLGFYTLVTTGVIDSPLVHRYFSSNQVEIVTTALFFVGVAAMVMRLLGLTAQFAATNREVLDPPPPGGNKVSDVPELLSGLALLPEMIQQSYLVRRLREALEHIRRKDSAENLEEHLRHLQEVDAVRMMAGYSMIRIVIWAIPILGFLGTVIGITLAIAELSPESLENSLPSVTSSLGMAFDTTALALSLSMVLMFAKFCVERVEERLLASVDARVDEEMIGRFQTTGTNSDPNVSSIRLMSEQVLEAVESMTARQAQLWKSTIDESHEQWAEVTTTAGQILENSLSTTLRSHFEHHARSLNEGIRDHAEKLNSGAETTIQKLYSGAEETIKQLQQGADRTVHQLKQGAESTTVQLSQSAEENISRLRDGLEKMAELLVEALERHGEALTKSEQELAQENRRHLSEVEAALGEAMVVAADRQERLIHQSEQLLKDMQTALLDAASATVEQQQQLVKQGEVLLKVVDATGQIQRLENSLNQNLSTLGRAHNFEETLVSLSAALQLLSARLSHGQAASPAETFKFEADGPTSSAA